MSGLFGLLNLGARALQTQRTGVEIAGQNLANVNNPSYARQRVAIGTAPSVDYGLGPQGTGSEAISIVSIRNEIIDGQIVSESSVLGSLESQQKGLQYAQASLGEVLDTTGNLSTGGHGISAALGAVFDAFQAVSGDPRTLSTRQALVSRATDLSDRFREVDQRLDTVLNSLDDSLSNEVDSANAILSNIADLNDKIVRSEAGGNGRANELRDFRQSKLEELSKLVSIDVTDGDSGAVNIAVAGVSVVEGNKVVDGLETYKPDGERLQVRTQSTKTPLSLTGGAIEGTIDVRDGAISKLRSDINQLASTLISQINDVYKNGYDLDGGTGQVLFEGTNAADIRVNETLQSNPAKLQTSAKPNEPGNNGTVLALSQLGHAPIAALNGQTFIQRHGQSVSTLGEALNSVTTGLEDQGVVGAMLQKQRDSVSGVSMDEEMTDLTRFQKAFAASARLITVVDQMLEDVIGLKR